MPQTYRVEPEWYRPVFPLGSEGGGLMVVVQCSFRYNIDIYFYSLTFLRFERLTAVSSSSISVTHTSVDAALGREHTPLEGNAATCILCPKGAPPTHAGCPTLTYFSYVRHWARRTAFGSYRTPSSLARTCASPLSVTLCGPRPLSCI